MLRERPVAKKIKSGDPNRLVDVKGRDSQFKKGWRHIKSWEEIP